MLKPLDTLAHWRAQIFSSLLTIVLALGALTAVPSIVMLIREGHGLMALTDAVALAWVAAVWWFKRLPYTVRVLNVLAIIFVLGVGLMVTVGSVSQIYLFSGPVLAAILLGTRPALWMLATSAGTVFLLSYTGLDGLHIAGMPHDTFAPSLVVALNYLFISSIITLSCSTLLQRLATSLDDLHRLAFYDVLTGLPNRRLLLERIDRQLEHAQYGLRCGALMYIDLDHFKYINDARGHAVGDALLKNTAGRLLALVREDDTVARIGGDEFVVLLANAGGDSTGASATALAVAETIRQALTDSVLIEGQSYNSSASIGITLLPKPGQTADHLLGEADIAMYRAKRGGRNRITFFETTMQAQVEQRVTLERDLASALEHGELAMHLQLQVDRDGAPAGAEMLMRWRRADGTMVPPDLFIPVAEESGLILRLGRWALREACLSVLRLAHAGHPMPLSVNVSPSQFRQPDFVAQVRTILEETGAPATRLIFEVTEGLLIDGLDDTIDRMHELALLGIRLSIDDFGTGYSSLAYLRRMPLYELKIDKSFIHDTPGDANGTAIVQSILAMAGHLGLRVIAEGVETREQAAFLASNGAAGMQGYLFARPMPMTDLIALLATEPARQVAETDSALAS
jgi:diguanylate cyclase (GGDEF)-like protein